MIVTDNVDVYSKTISLVYEKNGIILSDRVMSILPDTHKLLICGSAALRYVLRLVNVYDRASWAEATQFEMAITKIANGSLAKDISFLQSIFQTKSHDTLHFFTQALIVFYLQKIRFDVSKFDFSGFYEEEKHIMDNSDKFIRSLFIKQAVLAFDPDTLQSQLDSIQLFQCATPVKEKKKKSAEEKPAKPVVHHKTPAPQNALPEALVHVNTLKQQWISQNETDEVKKTYFNAPSIFDVVNGKQCLPIRTEDSAIEAMLRSYLAANAPNAKLVLVTPEYYSFPLAIRKEMLGAPSVDHLCKTVIMENTHHTGEEGNPYNSRFYAVVFQYVQKLNCERVKDLIKSLNEKGKLANRKLNFNFAKEPDAARLTGYLRNCITPFCFKDTSIPVILSKEICELNPPMLWLGGGEIDSKIGIPITDFVRLTNCIIGEVCFPGKIEEQQVTD